MKIRPTINKNCLNCNKTFAAQIRYVKKGAAKFCSIQCVGKYKTKNKPIKQSNIKCAWCSSSFYIKPCRIKKSKSGLFFCCREHKDLAQRMSGLDELQPAHYGTAKKKKFTSAHRRIAFASLPHKCNKCNYNEYLPLLEVHHINKNHFDNDICNLEILCIMCHKKFHYGLK